MKILCVALLISLVSSCANKKQPVEKKPKEEKEYIDKLVGRVLSYDADSAIVLIQAYGKWRVAEGEIVYTRGPEGRTASILPTGESTGHYVAADYRSGELQGGDGVYWRQRNERVDSSGGDTSEQESESTTRDTPPVRPATPPAVTEQPLTSDESLPQR